MNLNQLRFGRFLLLVVVAGVVVGAVVAAVRTIPDPELFSSGTATTISIAVTVGVVAVFAGRPPAWLVRGPRGESDRA